MHRRHFQQFKILQTKRARAAVALFILFYRRHVLPQVYIVRQLIASFKSTDEEKVIEVKKFSSLKFKPSL